MWKAVPERMEGAQTRSGPDLAVQAAGIRASAWATIVQLTKSST
jgi:hypothetical protein